MINTDDTLRILSNRICFGLNCIVPGTYRHNTTYDFHFTVKVKVGDLCPVQQPGSFWDRFSALSLVGLTTKLANH